MTTSRSEATDASRGYTVQNATKVGFDGTWCVFLTCGHVTPAKNEEEARRMSALGVPVRCYKCGRNGDGDT